MGILQTLIKELKTDDRLQQIRELCDQIQREEASNILHPEKLLKGPNIFLSLEVPGRYKKEIGCLSLIREFEEEYVVVYSTSLEIHMPKRQKVWEINDYRPEKILTTYAKIYKHLRGE